MNISKAGKSGIRWLNEGSFQVLLPNGRKLELDSRDDADYFVATVGTDFIPTKMTAASDEQLQSALFMMRTVSEKASPEKIASGVPESELCIFIEHMRDTLNTLSFTVSWAINGPPHFVRKASFVIQSTCG